MSFPKVRTPLRMTIALAPNRGALLHFMMLPLLHFGSTLVHCGALAPKDRPYKLDTCAPHFLEQFFLHPLTKDENIHCVLLIVLTQFLRLLFFLKK